MRYLACFVVGWLAACGGAGDGNNYDQPKPSPAPTSSPSPGGGGGTGGGNDFASVKPLVDANCGPCHNGSVQPLVFDSEAKFKTAAVKGKITSGAMPPAPRKLDATVKAKLLAYLNG